MDLSREELHELFEYDESLASCLRWKGCYHKWRNGSMAGSYVEEEDRWSIVISRKHYPNTYIIWQMFHGDLDKEWDSIERIDKKLPPTIDNIYRTTFSERKAIMDKVANSKIEDLIRYEEGKLYWNLTYFTGEKWRRIIVRKDEEVKTWICEDGYRQIVFKFNDLRKSSIVPEHTLIWVLNYGRIPEGLMIDHIDRNRSNNRLDNLRLVTAATNARNAKLSKSNKSGVSGVHLAKINCERWVASYHNPFTGKKVSKAFSVNKYGKEESFRLACEWRGDRIKEVNEALGDEGYTEHHGT